MNERDYELLYQNSGEIDSSDEEDEDDDEDDEDEYKNLNKIKYCKTIFNFLIDSVDRNWYTRLTEDNKGTGYVSSKANDINTFNFKVKFGEGCDTIENTKIWNSDLKKYEIKRKTFYNIQSLSFPINVKNIESIKIQSVILPKRLIYLGEGSYSDILNYRYLLICIEEISNTYYGTHKDINKAIAVLYPLSAVYENENLKHIEYVDKGNMIKHFSPTPLNTLSNLQFIIKDPNGNILNFKNDILTIKKIEGDNNNFIKITTNEYFNGEYQDKDIIKIKNFTSLNKEFNNFINRDKGHRIYIEDNFRDTKIYSIAVLKNTFSILCAGEYDGHTFNPKSDIKEITDIVNDNKINGEILNTNLQLSIFLKIETKTIQFDSLDTQII